MDSITQALKAVWGIILDIVGAVVAVIAVIEAWLAAQLLSIGVRPPLENIILIAAAVVLVLLAFRALRGLLRVLFVLLLILFAIHVALPLIRQ